MILSCNSCEKKFVVPDNAIGASGRLVQCSSCGNKWTQYPINKKVKTKVTKTKIFEVKSPAKKIKSSSKTTRKKVKKKTGPDLYSPEYLAKKHGINLNNITTNKIQNTSKKISFGFYNSLILFIILIITISRGLYFFQDYITQTFPFTDFYLNYFFESIRNMFEIFKNLISNY